MRVGGHEALIVLIKNIVNSIAVVEGKHCIASRNQSNLMYIIQVDFLQEMELSTSPSF